MDRPAPDIGQPLANPGPVAQEGRVCNIDVHRVDRPAFVTGNVVPNGHPAEGHVGPDVRVIGKVDRTAITGDCPLGGRLAVLHGHLGEGDLLQRSRRRVGEQLTSPEVTIDDGQRIARPLEGE